MIPGVKTDIQIMRADRRGYIGGSDISAVLGKNPFKSRAKVWAEKVGIALDVDLSEKEAVQWGIAHEPTIITQYGIRHSKQVTFCGTVRHDAYRFLAANPDGLIDEDGVLEAKFVMPRNIGKWGEQGTPFVPLHYYYQGVWYCGILKKRYFVLAALLGGGELRTYRFDFDAELFEQLVNAAVDFWYDHVLPKIPPDPQEETFEDDVRVLYPKDLRDVVIEVSSLSEEERAELVALCNQHEEAYGQKRAIEAKVKELGAKIQFFMKDASAMIVPGYSKPYTWRTNQESVVTDFEKVAKESGALIAKFNGGDATPYFEIVSRNTTSKTGNRPFNTPYSRSFTPR